MSDFDNIEDYVDQLIKKYSKDISLDISDLKKSRVEKKDREAQAKLRNPFKFLDPYTIEDKDIFFGREVEVRELYYRVFSNVVTVVFGESGVGKTSLLQCGFFSRLEKEKVTYFTIRSAINPLESLKSELSKQLNKSHKLTDSLDILSELSRRFRRTIILVFDQFEEIFILQQQSVRIELAKIFQKVLNSGLDVKIILTIREEYFAKLVEFERVIPYILENKVWVRKMAVQTTEEVVKNVCRVCHLEIEEKVLKIILSELAQERNEVELPLMQVVMDNLYSRVIETKDEHPRITYANYVEIGGFKNIFSGFIEKQVNEFNEPEKAKQILKSLVTQDGTKRVVSFKDLQILSQAYGKLIEENKLRQIIDRLIDRRILRESPLNHQFELRHDILAETIYSWMKVTKEELEVETIDLSELEKQRSTVLPFKKSHAFIIGINDYLHLPKLRTAVNDARKIAEVLTKQHGFKLHPPLLDAPYKKINHLLEKTIFKKVKEEDRVFFYFAGHGIVSDGEGRPEGYIIPADADRFDKSKFISMQILHDALSQLPCKHLLLVLDCCFAGTFKWASRYRYGGGYIPKRIFKERFDRFVKDPAWQVITSSAYDQSALDVLHDGIIGKRDNIDMRYSPFAQALIKGLQGAADIIPADGGDGLITASELYLYLRQQVEPKTIDTDERHRQTPGLFPLPKHDKGEYIFLHPRHRFNLHLPSIPNKRNPFKGLQSFEEGDMDLFYGRERVIEELMQKVAENNLIVVTGVSGTGKSSVVKAGLVPDLRKQYYNILPVLRPGKTPVAALENVLNESKLFDVEISISGNMNAVTEKLIIEKNVLVIDQFEELVTQCKAEKDRYNFINALKNFLDNNKKNLFKIILTVRADFEPQTGPALEEYWHPGRYTVPPFTTEELREIIVKPTVQEIFYIEPPGLVDRIINEVIQAPGALPLLSFAMSELYLMYIKSGRTDRVLHEEDYKKLGGVIGALHTCADYLYHKLDEEHRRTMRKIMLRMVSIEGNELAGERVSMKELYFSEDENSRVKDIIDKLLEARLILQNKDEDNQIYVEPAHDALIRSWPTLWKWMEGYGKDKILLQDRLSETVKDYADLNDKRLLWNDDPRLELLKAELQSKDSWLNKQEAKFIEESIKLKKRKKNRVWTIALSFIIILSALSIFSVYKAKEAQSEARIANANYLTSQALLKVKSDPITAIRLAEKAYYLNKNKNAMQVLSEVASSSIGHPFYRVNMQHKRPVNDAVFSPSGDLILTASSDNIARLWDLQGNLVNTFQHNNAVYSAKFSPDGTEILTLSDGKSAKLWDLQGNLLQNFEHKENVTSAVFSPDGRMILTASEDNTAKLWDLNGMLLTDYMHQAGVETAVFSPSGTRILTVSDDKTAALWDMRGEFLATFNGVISAEFSPQGQQVLTISFGNTIKLLDLDGNILKDFNNHTEIVTYSTFSPDGTKILAAYFGGAVKLWDLNGNLVADFVKHYGTVNSAVFSPDGTRILTASRDNTAKLWDMKGSVIADFDKHSDRVNSAVFSSDGTKILTASSDGTAKLWDLREQPSRELNHQRLLVIQAIFSPSGNNILVVCDDQTVQLWDLYGNLEASLEGHSKLVNSAVFSPDGTKILTASEDNTAKLWNLQGEQLLNLDSHTNGVNWAVFSPDGTTILTASDDNTAKLWDLQGKLLLSLDFHTKGVNRAIFSPDSSKILTASQDGTVKIWSLISEPLGNCNIHSWGVDIALFSPDSTKVLTVSTVAKLWNIKGELIAEYTRYTGSIQSAVFSPDGLKILTASDRKSATLWDLEGNAIIEFIGHENVVYSARFSPDGQRILTASADHTVKLWDLQGNMLADFDKHKGIIYSAVFSPDGNRVLSTSADRTVILWHTPEAIIKWLQTDKIPQLAHEEKDLAE